VKHACKIGYSKIMGHHRIEAPMMRTDKKGEFKEVSMMRRSKLPRRCLQDQKDRFFMDGLLPYAKYIKKASFLQRNSAR